MAIKYCKQILTCYLSAYRSNVRQVEYKAKHPGRRLTLYKYLMEIGLLFLELYTKAAAKF